jgi:hypothetical protein
MPLTDTPRMRGKCGYTLIQYTACGLPTLASPVGANVKITNDGRTVFFANSPEEWLTRLEGLAGESHLRIQLGKGPRQVGDPLPPRRGGPQPRRRVSSGRILECRTVHGALRSRQRRPSTGLRA